MDIAELTAIAADLSPLVLSLLAIVAFYRGWVVPQSVIKSIVADTVEQVHKRTQADNDKVIADISARIIAAMDDLLCAHEGRIIREFDRGKSTPAAGVKHL